MTDKINSSEIPTIESTAGLQRRTQDSIRRMIAFMSQIYQTTLLLNNYGVALPPAINIWLTT